jgi:tryptophan synthase beta chain
VKGVVADIAARRASDLARALEGRPVAELIRLADAAPPPRPFALALARPGMAILAEVKRRSPSAGELTDVATDAAALAGSYAAGGAAAISVLCEPHWFGGSVDDLAAVRRVVDVPVLAKEFVVDPRQLPLLRAAGADAVLLLAVLHPARRLAGLVDDALELGLEPLVEAHGERELERALATRARVIGVNNRDLRTLRVDPERAVRLRSRIPGDRIAIAESGLRDDATARAWRAAGFDAALVGEGLVRAGDPRSAVAALVAAGREPDGPDVGDRRPLIKICGVGDEAGIRASIAAGADAIGLNLVAGTPRALELAEAAALARTARATAPPGTGPRIVAITVDRGLGELTEIATTTGADVVQLNGAEPPELVGMLPVAAWKVIHVPADPPADVAAAAAPIVATARAHLAAGAERIMLDTAGGIHPGGTGRRAAVELVAAIAREVPVILAGGLDPANVGDALLAIPAVGVDVASGTDQPRVGHERPRKDPLRVALFVKRARTARVDRPHAPARPTPVDPGLLEADEHGRWGTDRSFGGRFVPETLMAAILELERAYGELRHDPLFWSELRTLLATYAGRPTPLYRADRFAAGLPVGVRLYLKREDLAHTGAHKINNALGQALLTRRLGKTRVIAETGAGQHGVATATACALLGLPCVVYMGAEDIARQAPNVLRMSALGAEVRPVTSGSATLKDAINEAMRDWVTNVGTTHYVLGSAMGPHPYPTIVRDLQRVIGDEAAAQVRELDGRLPDLVVACVGGGSNAIGLLSRFIGEPDVRLALVEAAGDGIATGRHAAALLGGSPGILHGARSYMLQDRDGQVIEAHSASAGLDYPGVGPQIAALYETGRLDVAAATDDEAFGAMHALASTEGILPALEAAHAIAALPALIARAGLAERAVVLLGLSGRGDKDLASLERWMIAR